MRYVLLLCLLAGCVSPGDSLKDFLTPDEFHAFYTDGQGSGSGHSYGTSAPWRRFSDQESDYTSWTVGLSWDLSPPPVRRDLREAARQMQISARLMAEAARSAPTARVGPGNLPITTESVGFQPPEPLQVVGEAHAPVVLTLPPALEAALLSWLSRVPSELLIAPVAAQALPEPPVVIVQQGAAPAIDITVENAATVAQPTHAHADAGKIVPEVSGEPQGVKLLGISSEVWTQLLVALGLLATAIAGYLGREKIPVVKNMTKKGRAAKAES